MLKFTSRTSSETRESAVYIIRETSASAQVVYKQTKKKKNLKLVSWVEKGPRDCKASGQGCVECDLCGEDGSQAQREKRENAQGRVFLF